MSHVMKQKHEPPTALTNALQNEQRRRPTTHVKPKEPNIPREAGLELRTWPNARRPRKQNTITQETDQEIST